MDEQRRKRLVIEPVAGCAPEVGRLLGMLEEARGRTRRALAGLSDGAVDWTDGPERDSIGTLLYHIAAIELDWLYVDALGREFPPEVLALLKHDVRDESGRLTAVTGLSVREHVARLEAARASLLEAFRRMTPAEFRRVQSLPKYDVTPEWVLHHLVQHEAEHRSQIAALRADAERALGES